MELITRIDREIKKAWADVKDDYNRDFMLREDCLKAALYYHIRRRLGNGYLVARRVRVFTEFQLTNGQRADIAVVRLALRSDSDPWLGIEGRVAETLAIIECKYKNAGVSLRPFDHDVKKVRQLLKLSSYRETQFYLAFVHERPFDPETLSMLSERQKASWACGRLTELVGCFVTNESKMHFEVIPHNGLNPRARLNRT